MKKVLLTTVLTLTLTGCESNPMQYCYPNEPCKVSQGSASTYTNLEQQLEAKENVAEEAEALEDILAPVISPNDISEDDKAIFFEQPVEEVKGLGIEGRKISPDVAIAVASANYGKTGSAKPIISDNRVSYPYGIGEAVLTCIPSRVCIVELQKGEQVTNVVIGDSENWNIAEPLPVGTGSQMQYHILLKSSYDDHISTNMVITTDRRIYEITLKNVPSGQYTPKINFYYPSDMIAWQHNQQQKKEAQEAMQTSTTAISYENLNFEYNVSDAAGKPWAPANVFDDGRKVFIQMSRAMDVTEAPVLLEKTEDGTLSIVNYRLKGNTYIVDKLFTTAILKLGADDDEVITIERKG